MSRLKSILADVRKFAIQLAEIATPPAPGWFALSGYNAMTEEFGGFSLSDDEHRRYREIYDALAEELKDRLSKTGISGALDRVILITLDPRGQRPEASPEHRAKEAVAEMEALFTAAPKMYRSYIPLRGLTPPKEPWVIGNVVIFDIAHAYGCEMFQHVEAITRSGADPEDSKEHCLKDVRKHLVDEHPGQAFAEVTGNALDSDAAWQVAKRRLRFVLDCLNFVLDVHYRRGEITDTPPRRHYRSGLTLQSSTFSSYRIQSEVADYSPAINADDLLAVISEEPGFVRILEYLSEPVPNGHQNRVLSALHWAGRAHVDRRPEEAFLHRAIALESMLLGSNEAEITNRLALSTVHLLGNQLVDRKQSMRHIKELYKVRSQIVHAGNYEVAPSDLARLRSYLHRAFARVLKDEPFIQMRAGKDLDEWLAAVLCGDTKSTASAPMLPKGTREGGGEEP